MSRTSVTEGNVVSPTSDELTTIVSQDLVRSARGVARAAFQIDLQLLEFGYALIDAPLPYLAQRFPGLRRYRMDIRQDGQLPGDFLEVEARALRSVM